MPPIPSAALTPAAAATAPEKRPPIGVEPANSVVYTLMTRPRRTSGTFSWMIVLHVAAIEIVPQPMMNMSTRSGPNELDKRQEDEADAGNERARDEAHHRRPGAERDQQRAGERTDAAGRHEEAISVGIAVEHVRAPAAGREH